MAEAAKRLDHLPVELPPAPQASRWSGEVHGPVAAMHQAIEAGLAAGRLPSAATERPMDRLLRVASQAAGWTVLAAAFAGSAAVIF